jgi:hypothetical protein
MTRSDRAVRLALASGGKPPSRRSRYAFGFVDHPVNGDSCETCYSMMKNGKCGLFVAINEKMPNVFHLEEKVDRDDYCKAFIPKVD